MRALVLLFGASVMLAGLEARAVERNAFTGVSVSTATPTVRKATPQKAEKQKVSFLQRVKAFFTGLEKWLGGWAPFSLIVLAIIAPPLAVGIASNWDPDKALIALLLTFLCYLPGVIYAIIQVSK